MTSTAITRYIEAPLTERHEYARALASAGDLIPRALFGAPIDGKPAAPSPGKVLLVIETGAMLNIHPIAALSSINVIEGKPAASAALMSAVLRGAGHKVRVTETGTVEGGDYSVTTTLIRSDDPEAPFTSTWTPQRAARAGLCSYTQNASGIWEVKARSSSGKALPWENYTESLCKARSVSEVGRDGGQDALLGVRYTPEELGGVIDGTGEWTGEIVGEEADEPAPSALPAARKRATNGTQGTKRAPKAAAPAEEPTEPQAAPEPTPEPEPEAPAKVEQVVDAEVVTDEQAAAEEAERQRKATISANVAAAKAEGAAKRAERGEAPKPDPDAVDRDDEAAVAQWNETHGKATGHLLTSNAELARRLGQDEAEQAEAKARAEFAAEAEARAQRAAEHAEDADPATGVIDSDDDGEAAVQAIKAARVERGAPTASTPIETPEQVKEIEEPWGEASEFEEILAKTPEAWDELLAVATTVEQVKVVWDNASRVGAMTTSLKLSIIEHKKRVAA